MTVGMGLSRDSRTEMVPLCSGILKAFPSLISSPANRAYVGASKWWFTPIPYRVGPCFVSSALLGGAINRDGHDGVATASSTRGTTTFAAAVPFSNAVSRRQKSKKKMK